MKDTDPRPLDIPREQLLPRSSNGLLSDAEQNQLHSFLDGVDELDVREENSASNNPSTHQSTSTKRSRSYMSIEVSSPDSLSSSKANSQPAERNPRKRGRSENSNDDDHVSLALGDSPQSRGGGRGRKPSHELLTEEQKKANHIASEQKRRANIRIGFDKLVDIVPTLSQSHRSESQILQKSADYIRQLVETKNSLSERVRAMQTALGDVPDEYSSEGEMESER